MQLLSIRNGIQKQIFLTAVNKLLKYYALLWIANVISERRCTEKQWGDHPIYNKQFPKYRPWPTEINTFYTTTQYTPRIYYCVQTTKSVSQKIFSVLCLIHFNMFRLHFPYSSISLFLKCCSGFTEMISQPNCRLEPTNWKPRHNEHWWSLFLWFLTSGRILGFSNFHI